MAKSRHKQRPNDFDINDFLPGPENGMETAVASLLRPQIGFGDHLNSIPPPNLIPGPAITGHELTSLTDCEPTPPQPNSAPGPNLIPGPTLIPRVRKRRFPIREMRLAQDAHTRAEQHVYECLWADAKPLDDISRVITIGFGGMSRRVGLSESNARINARSLIAKLAIEEFGNYDCERSTGRTYRIFNYTEILRRRREAGLTWYMRRTLAVVFVDPVSGEPITLPRSVTGVSATNSGPGLNLKPGINSIPGSGLKLRPDAGPNLGGEPGPNLIPLYREQDREEPVRETSSSARLVVQVLQEEIGIADDEAARRIQAKCRENAPDATDEEIASRTREEARRLKGNRRVENPVGLLIVQVPKRFEAESFRHARATDRKREEQSRKVEKQQQAALERFRQEQHARLLDPNVPENDKVIIRRMLEG